MKTIRARITAGFRYLHLMRLGKIFKRKRPAKQPENEENPGQVSHHNSFGNEVLIAIQNALLDAMHLKDYGSEKFICGERLKKVWRSHPVKSVPAFENYDDYELEQVEERFLRVLSILVLIGWDLRRFRPVFLRGDDLDDCELPFTKGKLHELRLQEQNFLERQWMFTPAVIQNTTEASKQSIDTNRRLPFIEKPVDLGTGGFGTVTKRLIAVDCYEETTPDGISRNREVRQLVPLNPSND